jgi:hypothetical protein
VIAAAAGTRRLRFAELAEQRCVLPDIVKTVIGQNISRKEAVVDRERARVDVAHRIDETHDAACTAQVQAGQRTGLAQP